MTATANADFIDQIERLPPLSTVVHRVMAMTNSGDASAIDIADALSEDQALTAKLLRVANSSFFGTGRRVTQVSRAVMMLGTIGVRNLVLGVAARDSLKTAAVIDLDHSMLWRHSIAVGSACETVARQIGYRPPEEAFVAGLLHDIGQLAMMSVQPEGMEAVMRRQGHGVQCLALEREQFGIDHTEAGFRILNRWQIPDPFCHIALRHHSEGALADGPHSQLLAIVMLGDTLAQMMGFGLDMPIDCMACPEIASRVLGLDEAAIIRIVHTLNQRVEQAVEMFASVDTAQARLEPPLPKRAVWISSAGSDRRSISRLLLEQHGYEVVRTAPPAADDLPPADLTLVELSDNEESVRVAAELAGRGRRGVVVLADPSAGAALRSRDEDTHVCSIPRRFTAFDVDWLEGEIG